MYRVNVSAPNLMNVCVDGFDESGPSGRLYNKFQSGGTEFHNVFELIQKMEKTCDLCQYPQSSTRQRSFGSVDYQNQEKKVDPVVDAKELLENKGELASFVIHVKYRQNSTWQGDIFWAEKQEKCYFRSALEMIKLIDSALDQTEENGLGEKTEE